MEKVLLDTDIGGDIDDAICLAYLLKEPQCNLLGITTVCGEPERRAAVADAICRAAGRSVPIVAGTDKTLQPVPVYPTPEGAYALEHWPHKNFEAGDAPSFLYEKIRQNPHEVILIGIGNMTNIALMFRNHPDAPGLLKELYVMNGYFGAEKLPDPTYNWNSWADPLASKEVFAAFVPIHRVIPLEVTNKMTIEAGKASLLLNTRSTLMQAVFDFGSAWLQSAGKLTLHDPLAAVSVFHPELCCYERGNVQVETENAPHMGKTAFHPAIDGNVEILRSADRKEFYRILGSVLNEGGQARNRDVPPLVASRAKSAGAPGEAWLANLGSLVSELEAKWNITVHEALSGGTHAFVAYADGIHGEPYVLKLDMPENLGGEFSSSMFTLKTAEGRGCAKLFRYDTEKKACLLERLGKPLSQLPYSITEQIKIICSTLEKIWQIPLQDPPLLTGADSVAWFREFIQNTWNTLRRPCSQQVINRALRYLDSREKALDPSKYVLLHGDAHANNTLETISGDGFKLIDPDGIFYEKAYDAGVLMREWIDEYSEDPLNRGRERCSLLHRLTGAPAKAIWEWGYLQTVSTAFVLLQIGQEQTGYKMLKTAEDWSEGPEEVMG